MKISIQEDDFDVGKEHRALSAESTSTGAVVVFAGIVREMDKGAAISSLFLEHYPGMTEKSLEDIAGQAMARWELIDITIIHRIGELKATDQIVLVGVSSQHRHDAFAACEFIMDFLKTRAPFWKKARDESGEYWVEAKESDEEATSRW